MSTMQTSRNTARYLSLPSVSPHTLRFHITVEGQSHLHMLCWNWINVFWVLKHEARMDEVTGQSPVKKNTQTQLVYKVKCSSGPVRMNKSHGIQKRNYSQGSFLSNVITSLCQRLQQVFTKYVRTYCGPNAGWIPSSCISPAWIWDWCWATEGPHYLQTWKTDPI